MKFGSVCSGIEAASVAWHSLGWRAAWLSEIEPFPSAVLAHHYPEVPNLGDMTKLPDRIRSGEVEAPDLFCGGTPCQAFSVAGLRKSLDDARGNLSLIFCEIADVIDSVRSVRGEQPATIFWENVPGVLNTKDNAFGCFLAGLAGEELALLPAGGKWSNAGCVYGPKRAVAWRVLDAQYFGVAQRRRRVFVVASAREGFDPAAVLFEFDGVRRDTAPSRKTGQAVTPTIRAGAANGGAGHGARSGDSKDELIVPVETLCVATGQAGAEIGADMAPTLNCNHEAPYVAGALCKASFSGGAGGRPEGAAAGHFVPVAFPANLSGTQCASAENIAPSMGAKNPTAVAVSLRGRDGGGTAELGGDLQNCLRASGGGGDKPHVLTAMQVRRLTPVECERLQGFPDGYTAIPWRKKPADQCPDGPRYKALGNSWAVPNVRWIGLRIDREIKRLDAANDNAILTASAVA